MKKLEKELKFYINCYVAELLIQILEVPKVVYEGTKDGKFKFISVQSKSYRIAGFDEVKYGVLNVQIVLF